ncbi:MAG: hypothetical protein H0W86_00800 [Armatimonadetes bacterium]|nr:hypothetical protein [Armatimonadota bacterium]
MKGLLACFAMAFAPDGPEVESPLEGWLEEDVESGPNQMDLGGVGYAAVSEPVSLLALGGSAGLAGWPGR